MENPISQPAAPATEAASVTNVASEAAAELPSEAQVFEALEAVVRSSDLETITVRQVRQQLEATFSANLAPMKQFISDSLMKIVQAVQAAVPDAAPAASSRRAAAAAPKPAKKRKAETAGDDAAKPKRESMFAKKLQLSTPLAELFGETHMSRSEATKRIWAYIREHNLPKTKAKTIQLDDALAKALRRKTISFGTLSRALNEQMKDPQFLVDSPSAAAASSEEESEESSEEEDE